jgi:hypothetical protein
VAAPFCREARESKATLTFSASTVLRGARGTPRPDARTLMHARRLHSPNATAGYRVVMKQADPFDCFTPDSWVRCPKGWARSGLDRSADRRNSLRDRRQPRWTTCGSVLHSDPQSERLALPVSHAADHSSATPRATHTRRNR